MSNSKKFQVAGRFWMGFVFVTLITCLIFATIEQANAALVHHVEILTADFSVAQETLVDGTVTYHDDVQSGEMPDLSFERVNENGSTTPISPTSSVQWTNFSCAGNTCSADWSVIFSRTDLPAESTLSATAEFPSGATATDIEYVGIGEPECEGQEACRPD